MEHSIAGNEAKVEYENQMLEAFVNNPEKTSWYYESFKKYQINGIDKMTWNWSWWAFFGGIFFLLYRKAYLAALVLFVLTMILSSVPIVSFVLSVMAGGLSTYFIYKTYKGKKEEIENTMTDTQKRVDTMRVIGGYNTWVLWVAGVLYGLIIVGVISILSQ